MRDISKNLKTHLKGGVTTISTLWKVTRRDGRIFGYTDAVNDLTVLGVLFKSGTGFSASAISHSAKFNTEHIEVDGFTPIGGIDDVDITDKDLLDGKYDFADVEISQVNYERPGDGQVKILKGHLGQFELKHNQFRVELISLGAAAQHKIGAIYSLSCRAKLGDLQCKIPLATTAQELIFQVAGPMVAGDTISVEVSGRDINDLIVGGPLTSGDKMFVTIDGVELVQSFASNNDTTIDGLALQINAQPNVESAIRTGTDTIRVTSVGDNTAVAIISFQIIGTAPPSAVISNIDGANILVSQVFSADSNSTMDLFAAKLQLRPRILSAVVSSVTGTDTERDIILKAGVNGTDIQLANELISPSTNNIIITQTVAGSAGQTFNGVVSSASSRQRFLALMPLNVTGDFDFGVLTWINGENQGRQMEVKAFINDGFGLTINQGAAGAIFDLFLPMSSQINAGDNFTVNRGCDYKFITCKDKFDNVKNFRGEPHIPTPEDSAQNPRTL